MKKRAENFFSLVESFSRLIVLNYSRFKRKERLLYFIMFIFPFRGQNTDIILQTRKNIKNKHLEKYVTLIKSVMYSEILTASFV